MYLTALWQPEKDSLQRPTAAKVFKLQMPKFERADVFRDGQHPSAGYLPEGIQTVQNELIIVI